MANLLPQDNYDSFLSVPLNDSDTTAYVDTLPTKTAGYLVLFEQDGRTFREKIKYTGVASTPNRLTGLTRGLAATDTAGAYPDTAGTGLDHPSQVRIAMTDNVNYLGRALAQLNGTEELGGVPQMPAARTIDSNRDVTDKEYVDAIAASAGGISAFQVTQNGADPSLTINVGAGTFISGSLQTAYAGAAAQAVTANQTNYVQLSKAGVLDINIAGFTDGYLPLATVVADAADITSITDKRPWLTMALTPNQVAALAGTEGTPSGTNKFVTSDDVAVTPAASKIPRANASGELAGWVPNITNSSLTTGEAIDGSTTPQVVCVKAADGLIYKADANDTALVNAYGFITTNALITTTPPVVTSGILGGFAGLTKGQMYYVQDAAGTIGVTPSTTTQIPVGRAISATEIEISFGKKVAFGSISHAAFGSGASPSSVVSTIGFRPARVQISGFIHSVQSAGNDATAKFCMVYAGTSLVSGLTIQGNTPATLNSATLGTTFTSTTNNPNAIVAADGANATFTGVTSLSDTGFTTQMTNVNVGTGRNADGTMTFIAFE